MRRPRFSAHVLASRRSLRTLWGTLLGTLLSTLPACDSEDRGEGELRVTAYGEAFVEDRIPAEAFVDGWQVVFESFVVAVHDVEADGHALDGAYLVDLSAPSDGLGHELGRLRAPAGQVTHLSYRVAPATEDASGNVDSETTAAMVSAGYSLRATGHASKGEANLRFDWGFATDTRYVDCLTEQPLARDGEATSEITLHADHLFYDDLDSMTPNVAFDLVAAADNNGDAEVTAEELGAVDLREQTRYQVGSRDITELWSFIAAQSTTLGHIDGEGHCEIAR